MTKPKPPRPPTPEDPRQTAYRARRAAWSAAVGQQLPKDAEVRLAFSGKAGWVERWRRRLGLLLQRKS
jgi:hypothetical protein